MNFEKNFLKEINVLDFSNRLPGPMASYILAGLGAKVIKIEDQNFGDPFNQRPFSPSDESFRAWYQKLNEQKEIKRFDFKNGDLEQTKKEIDALIQNADIIIFAMPAKIRAMLGLLKEDLIKKEKEQNWRPKVITEILASKNGHQALHDVNALGLAGLLPLHLEGKTDAVVAPPFLPIAGIGFGHHVATTALAALIKVFKDRQSQFLENYLMDSTYELWSPFWAAEFREKGVYKFLHNGLFPCYNIYRLKDGRYATLAAVEEKFWIRFCTLFKLELSGEDRFYHQDRRVFDTLIKVFSNLTSLDVKTYSEREEICLSLAN